MLCGNNLLPENLYSNNKNRLANIQNRTSYIHLHCKTQWDECTFTFEIYC